jgi:hypothetical protein
MIPLRFPKPDILRATEPDISFAPYNLGLPAYLDKEIEDIFGRFEYLLRNSP